MDSTKRGIILMNLGSPDSTRVPDVRKYLMEFLMDGRVIDYPYLFRKLLVGGIIVPFRAPKSAEAYRTIWTEEGSPLIVWTKKLRDALQVIIEEPVEIAMRYGNPDMKSAYENLLRRQPGLQDVLAIPLYPHYAMSSFETAVEFAKEVYSKNEYSFKLEFVKPYYKEPAYIHALAENIRPYLQQPYDQILFSYHGVPGRHIRKSDPTGSHCLQSEQCCDMASVAHKTCYRHQIFTTTRLVTRQLNIPDSRFAISFQSRLGKGWLEPFTDIRLEQLPAEGVRKLLILCPAFVSDCLETLEEIAIRGKETFVKAGGETYTMIPCLNTSPLWVQTLADWISAYAAGDGQMVLK
jgi:protoporphyrin/coproporphyrin ferrochelatase